MGDDCRLRAGAPAAWAIESNQASDGSGDDWEIVAATGPRSRDRRGRFSFRPHRASEQEEIFRHHALGSGLRRRLHTPPRRRADPPLPTIFPASPTSCADQPITFRASCSSSSGDGPSRKDSGLRSILSMVRALTLHFRLTIKPGMSHKSDGEANHRNY